MPESSRCDLLPAAAARTHQRNALDAPAPAESDNPERGLLQLRSRPPSKSQVRQLPDKRCASQSSVEYTSKERIPRHNREHHGTDGQFADGSPNTSRKRPASSCDSLLVRPALPGFAQV